MQWAYSSSRGVVGVWLWVTGGGYPFHNMGTHDRWTRPLRSWALRSEALSLSRTNSLCRKSTPGIFPPLWVGGKGGKGPLRMSERGSGAVPSRKIPPCPPRWGDPVPSPPEAPSQHFLIILYAFVAFGDFHLNPLLLCSVVLCCALLCCAVLLWW